MSGRLMLWGATIALTVAEAHACAVCLGDPGADMTKGMIVGIYALLGVVTMVLAGFAYFFIRVSCRARAIRNLELSAAS